MYIKTCEKVLYSIQDKKIIRCFSFVSGFLKKNTFIGLIVPVCGFNRQVLWTTTRFKFDLNLMANTRKYFDTFLIFYLVRSVYKKFAVNPLRGLA